MRRILQFLASDGAFLYEECNFRIIDSEYIASFGGTGSVTLRNELVDLRFSLDRDQLYMELRAVESKSRNLWFSMDILRQLLTGEITDRSLMDQENTVFLKANFKSLQKKFSKSEISTTESACRKLKNDRSKRLFG